MDCDTSSPMGIQFNLMAKPVGAACNLACSYCFYRHHSTQSGTCNVMSQETLETYITGYINSQDSSEVIFTWQGGEPTLAGLDFYREIIRLQDRYKTPELTIRNHLQTNGLNLDDEWCEFLKEHDFLVGLSIDGPVHIHNAYRQSAEGVGSFSTVMGAIDRFHRYQVPFVAMACIHAVSAKEPLAIYRFLRDTVSATQIQFIPVVEHKRFKEVSPRQWPADELADIFSCNSQSPESTLPVTSFSLKPGELGNFLCTIFDEWVSKDRGRIFLHYVEAAVLAWLGKFNPICTMAPMCGKCAVMEADGSIYSCDHYVTPDHHLCNISELPLREHLLSEKQKKFGTDKERTLPDYCRLCTYQFACFGGCPKNRFARTPDGSPGLNYLCRDWFSFFQHIERPVMEIADLIRSLDD